MTKLATKSKRINTPKAGSWKGVAPNHWKKGSSNSAGAAVGFQMVSVKMRPAEAQEFTARCKELGVAKNYALRVMARQVCGFLEPGKDTIKELKDISRQLRGVATNINQIAKASNQTNNPDFRAFMEDRQELGPELIRLQKYLQNILDLGVRREDGLARLKEAMEAS